VRRRLRADVPLGAFLSGGVDSGYVVSRMATDGGRRVRTFAMGTSDAAHDERDHARLVAAHCGTDHTEFEVTPAAWELLPRLVWEFGQPFADPACIPTYYVAARARQHVTVALTGDGGDESFAGYSHHHGMFLAAGIRRILPGRVVEGLLRAGTGLIDGGQTTRRASAARFLRYLHADPLVRWATIDRWVLHHVPRVFSARYQDLGSPTTLLGDAVAVDAEFDGHDALDRALHHDLNWLLPFCYNVKLDVATMMSSLEARSPFMDRDVVEWAARVPSNIKMRPTEKKALLKRVAARRLPSEVVYRPKHGFSLPMDRWFRGSWSGAAHHIIFSPQARDRGYFDYAYLEQLWAAHREGRANHGERFWSLLWLEMWHRMFVDRTLAPAGRDGDPGRSEDDRGHAMPSEQPTPVVAGQR
jgi:asparagine synthase (glutamine-hydrolysing)